MANSVTTCSNEENLDSIHRSFTTAVRAPEKFISPQNKLGASLTGNTKQIFDFVNRQSKDNSFPACPLDELLTEGFDEEQIWQEIELLNTPSVPHLLQNISNVIARKHKLTFSEEQQRVGPGDENVGDEFVDEEEEELFDDVKNRLAERGSSDEENDDSDTNFAIEDVEEKTSKRHRMNTFRPTRVTPSVVDDKFFKLSEMERFLEMEDAKEEQKRRREEEGKEESEEDESSDEEGDFDYFEELDSTDEDISDDEDDDEVILSQKLSPSKTPSSRDMKYTDFFPAPEEEAQARKQVRFREEEETNVAREDEGIDEDKGGEADDGDEDDKDDDDNLMEDAELRNFLAMKAAEESESEGEDADDVLGRTKPEKSSFEARQERLKERIQQLEESNISVKPWQMIGEVGGRRRPDNSLLEERLDFEVASKPAPVITEETTQSIETLIMQRIKDQAWDDVERKIKPKEEAFEFKKRITLDQEKSKISLGEIYEQEYLKKTQENPEEEEEDPAHQEINKMMDSLFVKLDALSNYHFTPKPAIPELKIVTNVPAISMEEVQPISVTDATLLAPEEVKEKSRTEVKGDTEKTQTDRKRERRNKKKGQKLRAHVRERKEQEAEKGKPEEQVTGSKDAAMTKLEKLSKTMSNKTSIVKDDKSMDKKLLTSSKAFFSKLQEEAASEVKVLQKRKKLTDVTISSKTQTVRGL